MIVQYVKFRQSLTIHIITNRNVKITRFLWKII